MHFLSWRYHFLYFSTAFHIHQLYFYLAPRVENSILDKNKEFSSALQGDAKVNLGGCVTQLPRESHSERARRRGGRSRAGARAGAIFRQQ